MSVWLGGNGENQLMRISTAQSSMVTAGFPVRAVKFDLYEKLPAPVVGAATLLLALAVLATAASQTPPKPPPENMLPKAPPEAFPAPLPGKRQRG